MNLEAAILKIINSKKEKATTREIYSALEKGKYYTLRDNQLAETIYEGRPAYQHEVRSYLSNLCQKGLLKWISRGYYALEAESGKTTKKQRVQQTRTPSDIGVLEGRLEEATYLRKSRNRDIVEQRKKLDRNTCQVCGFKFSLDNTYVIECHHKHSLAAIDKETVTTLDDLVCLCPNCHRIAHIRKQPYSIEELKNLIGTTRR